jgi:hypothetical protein
MKNTRTLRSIILFIAVTAAVYDISFFIKVYLFQDSIGKNEMLYGFWALPVAMVFAFLYSFLNKSVK